MAMVHQLCMCESGNSLHPLILIPGAGGNQLEARLTKDYKSSTLFCSCWNPIKKDSQGWYRLWFSPTVLLAPYTDCFAHRMTLHYDRDLDDYRNEVGVQTRVKQFGSVESLLYLDPNLKHFIKHLVALSTPWGGSVEGMRTFASGNTLGVPLVNPLRVRTEQRSSESNLWLLPNPTIYERNTPIVITQNSNYTVEEIPRFLKDIGFEEGVYPYESRILPLMEQFQAPGVDLTCVIGGGVRTPETLLYGAKGFDEQPEKGYGDGDGTVNMVSLRALEKLWANEKNQTLETIEVGGVSHKSILEDREALDVIIREISRINSMAPPLRPHTYL